MSTVLIAYCGGCISEGYAELSILRDFDPCGFMFIT